MSFFSEKVLKRPPAEEVKGYSLREIEIARKNYNYGHNVCFYTVMVCFIIWAILCSVFRPSVAHASELVGGDEPIVTPYDNYLVLEQKDGNYIFVCVNYTVVGSTIKFDFCKNYSGSDSDSIVSDLESGSISKYTDSISYNTLVNGYNILFSSSDFYCGDVSFLRTPCLVHKVSTVGGLAAPEIAKAIVVQILGLVPLVLGLVVSAIGLRKALAMVFQRLRRA